jgi:hypothetical protein
MISTTRCFSGRLTAAAELFVLQEMKKRKTALLIGVGICLLALVMYPFARNAWNMHCLDVKARCHGTIYRSIVNKAVEAEPLGQKYSWPQTLSEMLDKKGKSGIEEKRCRLEADSIQSSFRRRSRH